MVRVGALGQHEPVFAAGERTGSPGSRKPPEVRSLRSQIWPRFWLLKQEQQLPAGRGTEVLDLGLVGRDRPGVFLIAVDERPGLDRAPRSPGDESTTVCGEGESRDAGVLVGYDDLRLSPATPQTWRPPWFRARREIETVGRERKDFRRLVGQRFEVGASGLRATGNAERPRSWPTASRPAEEKARRAIGPEATFRGVS